MLWVRRLSIATIVVVFVTVGVAYAWLKTPLYQGSVVLSPRESEEQGGALAGMLGQVSSLASLAGLAGVGGSGKSDSLAMLKSRAFFEAFARDETLLPIFFANRWDEKADAWKSTLAPDDVPTYEDAWHLFDRQIRKLTQDQKTEIVTLSVIWKDRTLAAEWANELARRINDNLRARAIAESTASLAVLQEQLDQTAVVELRNAIYRLMEIQIKKQVLARSRRDYAYSIIDPAVIADEDRFVSPKRALVVVSSFLLGILAALVFVILSEAKRQGGAPRNQRT